MQDQRPSNQVFVSYASANRAIVDRLFHDLTARGINVWIDKSGLEPGTEDWEQALRDAIRNSWAVLFVASPTSRRSRYVKDELRIANMYQCRIYPVWVDGDELMDALPMGLGGTQMIDLRGDRYAVGLDALIGAFIHRLGIATTPAQIAPVEVLPPDTHFVPRNPYKGLKAFTGEDIGDFFGRDALIQDLVKAVGEATAPSETVRFLAVIVGPSGSGKSSVVMAGLLPKLNAGILPGSEDWVYLEPMVPGNQPLESLALTLKRVLPESSIRSIKDDLRDDAGRGLHLLARQIAGRTDRRVVLLIDQFEELFTLTADEAERRRFIDLLVTAVTEPRGTLLGILTLRADFYDRPLSYPALGALLEARSKAILPMELDDLRSVIERPAALPDVRLTFEDGLVGDLLFEVRGEAAALPLLQFTLDQLFQRREGLRLTRKAYLDIGGVRGALAKHAEQTYLSLSSEDHQALARALFLRLIEPGVTEQDTTRRRAALHELQLDDPMRTTLYEAVARSFIDARLLTTSKVGEQTTIEVSHEALIREWTRLGEWLKTARGDLHLQKEVAGAALAWTQRGSRPDDDGLYRGSLLQNAQEWARRNTPSLDEVRFLNAGTDLQAELIVIEERRKQELLEVERRAQQAKYEAELAAELALNFRRKAQRLQQYSFIGIIAAITLLIITVMVGVIIWIATNNHGGVIPNLRSTNISTPQFHITGYQHPVGDLAISPDGKKVVVGYPLRDVYVSEYAPIFDLNTTHPPAKLVDNGIVSVAFSPDGKSILTGDRNGNVRLWDAEHFTILQEFSDENSLTSVGFSPNGTMVLAGDTKGTLKVWDIASTHVLLQVFAHSDYINNGIFSPDGKFILTTSDDKTARLWDATNGKQLANFEDPSQMALNYGTFSANGYVALGSDSGLVYILDAKSLIQVREFWATDPVQTVVFSPNGEYLLTTSKYEKFARLWNTSTGNELQRFGGDNDQIDFAIFSPDGQAVILGGENGAITVFSIVLEL
jgi:hypothetical protein